MERLNDLESLYDFSGINISDIENYFANNTLSALLVNVSTEILVLFIVLYGTISLLAVIGNALVILVVLRIQAMRTVTNILLANMAIADVAIALFSIPFQFHTAILQRWIAADVMCKIAPFVKTLSVTISILTLTVIAIDRYVAVVYPFKAGFRKRSAFLVIFVIWVVGIASSMPDLIFFDVEIYFDVVTWTKRPVCNSKWPSKTFAIVYFLFLFLLQYIVPFIVIIVFYCRIICKIRRGGHGSESEIGRCHQSRSLHRKKVVKMLITVTSLFALCWLPLQSYNVINAVYRRINRYKYINIIWFCANWLAMSNSCYNPFIYGLLNEKFQQEFKNLFKYRSLFKGKRLSRQFLLTSNEVTLHKNSHFYNSLETLNRKRRAHVYKEVTDSKKETLCSKSSGPSKKSDFTSF